MTQQDFDKLPLLDQAQIVLDQGIEVMNRIYLYYQIRLYSLNDFYTEIWYRQIGNKIDFVKSLNTDDVNHLYGREIDISDLFKS